MLDERKTLVFRPSHSARTRLRASRASISLAEYRSSVPIRPPVRFAGRLEKVGAEKAHGEQPGGRDFVRSNPLAY
jgi:hypothetical protein